MVFLKTDRDKAHGARVDGSKQVKFDSKRRGPQVNRHFESTSVLNPIQECRIAYSPVPRLEVTDCHGTKVVFTAKGQTAQSSELTTSLDQNQEPRIDTKLHKTRESRILLRGLLLLGGTLR